MAAAVAIHNVVEGRWLVTQESSQSVLLAWLWVFSLPLSL